MIAPHPPPIFGPPAMGRPRPPGFGPPAMGRPPVMPPGGSGVRPPSFVP
ncbi:MAG: hypothetical protein IKD40_00060 [Bacteroidaceae bacterium]|nr:hypothetical protein [Bacteroidaceae bacterium]